MPEEASEVGVSEEVSEMGVSEEASEVGVLEEAREEVTIRSIFPPPVFVFPLEGGAACDR